MGCLYQITAPSGKNYFGISKYDSHDHRWSQHKSNANKGIGVGRNALYDAIRKYGHETFEIKTVAVGTYEYVRNLEVSAIHAFNSKVPYGYNLSEGGEGSVGVVVSEETRKKQSDRMVVRMSDPIQRQASVESLKKAQRIKSERWWALSDDEREVKKAEHRKKLEDANRFTPEVRDKLSRNLMGKNTGKRSDTFRKNVAKGATKRWEDPKQREAASVAAKKRWESEEARLKQSEALKKARTK